MQVAQDDPHKSYMRYVAAAKNHFNGMKMGKTNATIYQLIIPGRRKLTSQMTSQSLVRDQTDRLALELAAATDELSLRISDFQSKPVAGLQIKKCNDNLARARALLAQLENSVDQLRPD